MYHDDVPIIVYYDANVDAVAIHHLSHLLPSQCTAIHRGNASLELPGNEKFSFFNQYNSRYLQWVKMENPEQRLHSISSEHM